MATGMTQSAAAAGKQGGGGRWLNHERRPAAAFERHELVEYERELAVRRHASPGSFASGSSSAGASSSRLTPVKREPEELGLRAIKLEADTWPHRGVIGPEDYLPPGKEEHLKCVIMERSAREEEEEEADMLRRCELDYKRFFLKQSIAASQAHAFKEADLRIMKAEQTKVFIDFNSDEDWAPLAPPPHRRCHEPIDFGSIGSGMLHGPLIPTP